MSLLREIQSATTNPSFKLADILRKAKILAARLEHQPFKNWIEKELNGYDSDDTIPPYRILTDLQSRGNFSGSFGSGAKNVPIPLLNIPKEFHEYFNQISVLEGVGAVESLVEQATQTGTGVVTSFWSPDAVALLSREFYQNMNCLQAWRDIPLSSYVSIIDTVKNKILDFSLEIEAEAPEAGEVKPGTKPVPEETINHIFENCIFNFKENIHNQSGNFGIGHMSSGEIKEGAKVAEFVNESDGNLNSKRNN